MSKPKISTADKKVLERVLKENLDLTLYRDTESSFVNIGAAIGNPFDDGAFVWCVGAKPEDSSDHEYEHHSTFAQAWKEFTK